MVKNWDKEFTEIHELLGNLEGRINEIVQKAYREGLHHGKLEGFRIVQRNISLPSVKERIQELARRIDKAYEGTKG